MALPLLGWLFKSGSERTRNINILDEGGEDSIKGVGGGVLKVEAAGRQEKTLNFNVLR